MNPLTSEIRARLGVPVEANYVLIFDQAGHFDWDWTQTFDEYFMKAYSGNGVNGALLSALSLLGNNGQGNVGPYYYSMCEMSFLQKFVSYQAQQDNNVITQFNDAGQSFRIVGGGITSPDNLVCSGEAFIRNYLLGRLWLGQNIPGQLPLKHCWLPDDFGQDPELPVVVQAMGLQSIAFARMPGGNTENAHPNTQPGQQFLQNGADFFWQSSDEGSKVSTHWLQGPGSYGQGSGIDNTPDTGVSCNKQPEGVLANISCYLSGNNANQSGNPPYSGAPTNYIYVPNDNDFMMPVTDLLSDLQSWNESTDTTFGYKATGVYAVQASFDDFVSLALDNSAPLKTVNYNGTPYWTGYYMSRPAMKILHYDAVRWLLAAEVCGLLTGNSSNSAYWQTVNRAWNDFMPSTHHDYVCGTANDVVYESEQLPVLQKAHDEAGSIAQTGLQALGAAINANYAGNPVVIANPAGAYYSVVELPAPVPTGIQGIQFNDGQTNNFAQPTYEGGLVFIAPVESLGYTTGYLTETEGSMPWADAKISPPQSGQQSYTLSNEYLTVVISADSGWGIQSITDSAGNSLLASGGIGNELVFYEDSGDIYEFGNEYTSPNYSDGTFESKKVTFGTNGTGLGATVLEQGLVRVRLQTVVSVSGIPGAENYTREYILVAGEPFLRMKTTGSAPSGYSVTSAFQLSQPIDTIVHGTACHWTSVQPLDQYPPPIFRATHRFLLPQAGSQVLGAIYHQDVPAWALTGDKTLFLSKAF